MHSEEIRDYYSELEVSRSATPDEIRHAFKRLAWTHHPDRRGGKIGDYGERFQAVNAAYAILSDAEKRERYDKFGAEGVDDQDRSSSTAREGTPDITAAEMEKTIEFHYKTRNIGMLDQIAIAIGVPEDLRTKAGLFMIEIEEREELSREVVRKGKGYYTTPVIDAASAKIGRAAARASESCGSLDSETIQSLFRSKKWSALMIKLIALELRDGKDAVAIYKSMIRPMAWKCPEEHIRKRMGILFVSLVEDPQELRAMASSEAHLVYGTPLHDEARKAAGLKYVDKEGNEGSLSSLTEQAGFQSEVSAAAMRKLEGIGSDKTWAQDRHQAETKNDFRQGTKARYTNAA